MGILLVVNIRLPVTVLDRLLSIMFVPLLSRSCAVFFLSSHCYFKLLQRTIPIFHRMMRGGLLQKPVSSATSCHPSAIRCSALPSAFFSRVLSHPRTSVSCQVASVAAAHPVASTQAGTAVAYLDAEEELASAFCGTDGKTPDTPSASACSPR